ncbi:MAG: hypothetical protein IJO63_00905 [Bacilli bacterium]|nr:hypothetical protein [Bacilli bacterium]
MNKIYFNNRLFKDPLDSSKFELNIYGENNTFYLNDYVGPGKIVINMYGSNNVFKLGKNNTIRNMLVIDFWETSTVSPKNVEITIGDENFFNGANIHFISPLEKSLTIGNGNLFAGDISIWGRNDHIIYDNKTKTRINKDQDIIIGNSNWICQNVTILSGAEIKDFSVVALGSIVNKKYTKSNVLIAGIPAKVKRKGINWSIATSMDKIDFENNIKVKE